MDKPSWKFPAAYASDNGLDSPEMETFKKDPLASLAREICQNSLDARAGDDPVEVEFSVFTINREDIPGIDDLTQQIDACCKYNGDSLKEGGALKCMLDTIKLPQITCLRISDFNTTGATGVSDSDKGRGFHNLTRGSGTSDKVGSLGGSKGIGKFATFVVSTTNTVFYATKTIDEEGYLGISHLRSIPVDPTDPALLTVGIGYFGLDKQNRPVQDKLSLDPCFERTEPGTDVYLIGFDDTATWKDEIVAKVLDSFMVAIMRGYLKVKVDGIEVNPQTIPQIVTDDDFGKFTSKKLLIREIQSQHALLQDPDVIREELNVDEEEITVFLKRYANDEKDKATRRIVMVRYPYMKITHITTGGRVPYSALCIIENNALSTDLRSLENPQHDEWQTNRLDLPGVSKEDKKRIKHRYNEMKQILRDFVLETLRGSTGESTDIVGAGDYLPSPDNLGDGSAGPSSSEAQTVTQASVTKARVPKTVKTGEAGEGVQFSLGDLSQDGEEGIIPNEPDDTPNPNPYPDPEPNPDKEKKIGPGDRGVLTKTSLSGMRCRNVAVNKSQGEYVCIFTSLFDEDDCEVQIRICGEGADKYPLNITSASINGEPCQIDNGVIVGLQLKKNEDYRITYHVETSELFASEVIINAYR